MSSITLSAGVRQSLSALQSAAAQSSVIQNRLATGKKVNSALDNPASFFTSSGLSNRAGDLGTLLDDMGQAIKTLEAADKAITAISKLVDNAKSIAKQAQAAPADVAATPAAAAKLTGTVDLTALSDTDGGTFSMTVGGTTKTVTFAGSAGTPATIDTVITAINTQFAGVAAKSADNKKYCSHRYEHNRQHHRSLQH
jgi:flagellin